MLRALAGGLWSMGGRLWNFWLHLVLKNQIVTTALVFSASTVVFSLATLLLFWFGYVVLVPNDLILPLHLDYGTTMTTSATTSTTGELHQQSAAACCASFGILDQKEEWRDQEFAQEPNTSTSTVDRDFYSDGFEKQIFTTSSSSFLRFGGRSLSKAKSIFGLKLVASVPSLPSAREYNNQLGPVSLQLSKKNSNKSPSIVLARRSFFAPAIDEGVVEQFLWRPLRKIVSRILHAEEEAVDFQIPLTENLSLKTVGPSDRLQLCLSPPVRMEQVYLVVEAELSGLRKWIRGYPYLFMFLALILSAITGFVTTAFLFVLSSIMASADDEEEEGTMPWVGGEDDHEGGDLDRVGELGEDLGGDSHRDRSPGGLSTLGVGGSSRRRRRSSDLVSSSGGEQEHGDQQDEMQITSPTSELSAVGTPTTREDGPSARRRRNKRNNQRGSGGGESRNDANVADHLLEAAQEME